MTEDLGKKGFSPKPPDFAGTVNMLTVLAKVRFKFSQGAIINKLTIKKFTVYFFSN